MKIITLLFTLILFTGCSKEENPADCECETIRFYRVLNSQTGEDEEYITQDCVSIWEDINPTLIDNSTMPVTINSVSRNQVEVSKSKLPRCGN